MKYAYKGFDRAGRPVADTIDANTVNDGKELLRRQNVYVTDIAPLDAAPVPIGGKGSLLGKAKRLKSVALFLRQLHVLIHTGTPLAESLAALERQTKDVSFKAVIIDVRESVEQGNALSQALARHPSYFNAICCGLIAAGETGSHLDTMLERLAALSRQQVHVRSLIVGAMVYPVLLTGIAGSVLAVLMFFVLPRFTILFQSLDTPLPPTTKLLMLTSALARQYWWSTPLLLGAIVGGLWITFGTPAGRGRLDWLGLRLPGIGNIVRSFETARLARLLGVLLQGKVPLVEALQLTRDATANTMYSGLLAHATEAVTRGDSLALALADERLVPPSVNEAIHSGEKSGQLGSLLSTLADFFDDENEVMLRSLTSVIEPIILIILGILVGFIAISLFMPMFDLVAATGGG